MRAFIASIDGVVERAWTADRQNRWLLGTGIVGALAGMLLWSVLPGEIARALPVAWQVPERMAARILRHDPQRVIEGGRVRKQKIPKDTVSGKLED